MTDVVTETRSVVMERDMPHPPGKVWRALTQPHLVEQWLMKADIAPEVGRAFTFSADWGSVDCQVMEAEPEKTLTYSWTSLGLDSVVTWTLTPTGGGTRLRMEQSGFRPDQEQAYQGAQFGWRKFFGALEQLLATAN